MYHVLDHDYTEANISLKALKTRDLAQVHVLKEMSSELAVDIFLALLEKEEMGSCESNTWDRRYAKHSYYDYDDDESNYHSLEEVFETKYAVKTLVDLEGHVVTQGLHLNEDDILQENCFENLEAEEEYEGFMGNSGPTATHWYRVTAVVIVPRDSLVSFFNSYDRSWYSSSQNNLKTQIRYLARACLQPQAPESSVKALLKLSQQAWNNSDKTTNSFSAQKPSIDGDGIRDVLMAAIQHGKYTFFEEAADHHQGLLPLDFFTWMRQWLSTGSSGTDRRFHAVRKGEYPLPFPHTLISPTSLGPSRTSCPFQTTFWLLTPVPLLITFWTGLVKNSAPSWMPARPGLWAAKMDLPWWTWPCISMTTPIFCRKLLRPESIKDMTPPPSFLHS